MHRLMTAFLRIHLVWGYMEGESLYIMGQSFKTGSYSQMYCHVQSHGCPRGDQLIITEGIYT